MAAGGTLCGHYASHSMARNGKYARLLWGHLPTLNLEVVGYIPGSREVQLEYSRTQHNDVIYMELKIRLRNLAQ